MWAPAGGASWGNGDVLSAGCRVACAVERRELRHSYAVACDIDNESFGAPPPCPSPRPVLPERRCFAAALSLSGCGSQGDFVANSLTAPGQYDLYDCTELKVAAKGIVTRQRQLEQLMARASQGPAGGVINATTYQPEYVTLRGKMNELRRAVAANHCNFEPDQVEVTSPPPAPAKKPAKRARRR